ncbi:MAG: PilZ domain-containing protein [Candidatus Omnitrophota bacterium]|nr:PilZ domain-containing protein [Candidatus Omnitrophota bacterium]
MNLNNSHEERRRSIRVESILPLRLKTPDFDIVTSTRNISSVGAYCQTDKYVAPMTKLDITLILNHGYAQGSNVTGTKVKCRGVVVRTEQNENKYNLAVFFNDISESEKEKINKFIKSLLSLP